MQVWDECVRRRFYFRFRSGSRQGRWGRGPARRRVEGQGWCGEGRASRDAAAPAHPRAALREGVRAHPSAHAQRRLHVTPPPRATTNFLQESTSLSQENQNPESGVTLSRNKGQGNILCLLVILRLISECSKTNKTRFEIGLKITFGIFPFFYFFKYIFLGGLIFGVGKPAFWALVFLCCADPIP